MYSITTLDGGQQLLCGQKSDIIEAIGLAVGYCEKHIAESPHKRKEHSISVTKVGERETMCPENAVAKISFCFHIYIIH